MYYCIRGHFKGNFYLVSEHYLSRAVMNEVGSRLKADEMVNRW